MFNNNGWFLPTNYIHFLKDVANKKNRHVFGTRPERFNRTLSFYHKLFSFSISRPTQVSLSGDPKTGKDKLAEACFKLFKELYKRNTRK
jgi:hypothetical protein